MAHLTLSILSRLLALLLLILPVLRAAQIGEQCTERSNCDTGRCVNGTCLNSIVELPVICGNKTCGKGEYCVTPSVMCKEGGVCEAPPPWCVSNSMSPCDNSTCLNGTFCVPSKSNVNEAQCIPIHPCENMDCKSGYICQEYFFICQEVGCIPIRGKCVPMDSLVACSRTTCSPNSFCTVSYEEPHTTVCLSLDPCASNPCPGGYDCVPDEKASTQYKCNIKDLCSTVKCRKGYQCQLKLCRKLPCPPPYPQCVPINPCLNTICKPPFICTQSRNDPTVAECVRSPCSRVRCAYTCTDIVEYCFNSPCPRPRPYCNNDISENPCALVDCMEKFICVNVPVTTCLTPPCPKYRAECKQMNV